MYIRKIKPPYNMAFLTPFDRVSDRFVKKETVSGMSGNTQGVNNAMNPPTSPSKKIDNKPFPSVVSSPQGTTGFFKLIEGILILISDETPPSRGTSNLNSFDG